MRTLRSIWPAILMFFLSFGLSALYVWRGWRVNGALGFPLDDSWIHAQFARNIIAGYGFSYNPGEPVSGSTSVLWTLLVALGYAFYMNPIFPTVTIGTLLHFLTGLVGLRLGELVTGKRWIGIAVGLTVVTMPRLNLGAVSGLEVPLYSFLSALAIYLHLKYRWDDGGARQYWGTAVMALAALSRPELLCLFPFAVMDRMLIRGVSEVNDAGIRRPLKTLLVHIGVYLGILSPWFVFNLHTAGSPFPNTYSAKVTENVFSLIAHGDFYGLGLLLRVAPEQFLLDMIRNMMADSWPLALAVMPGTILVIREAVCGGRTRSCILPLVLFGTPILTSLLAYQMLPQMHIHWGRYTAYRVVPFAVLGFYGLDSLAGAGVGEKPAERSQGRLRAAVLATAAFFMLIALVREQLWVQDDYIQAVGNINDMQVSIGEWIRANVPSDCVVASNDIGAIAYFGNHRVIDLMGLVTPEIIPYSKESFARYGSREEGILEYLKETRPDYLAAFPSWFPRITSLSRLLDEKMRVTLEDNLVCGDDTMIVYQMHWEKEPNPRIPPKQFPHDHTHFFEGRPGL